MKNKEEQTSGFVEEDNIDIDEQEFSTPQEYYSSASGCNQLFLVKRYGRIQLLKTLKAEYRGNDLFERALRKEFQIGFGLEHEHICRIIGWKTIDGIGNCILMEYVDGMTLKMFMESGRLTRELARRIAREIGSALAYMHNKQVLHRDLKPENVMITHTGNHVKLIDFSLSDSDESCVLKRPAGTPFYMAPEMREGKAKIDQRSDIYSFGVILGEMARLTGDSRMKAVSVRCTKTLPEARYSSVEEILEVLEVKKYDRLWTWIGLSAAILVLIVFLLGKSGHPDLDTPTISLHSGLGNVTLSDEVMAALMDGRKQMSQGLVTDTTEVMNRIRRVLDEEFPTEAMRQSLLYDHQWQAVHLLFDHEFEAAP